LMGEYGSYPFCPITAVLYKRASHYFQPTRADIAAKELGLSHELTNRIMFAADWENAPYEDRLPLLIALGL